MFGSRLGTLKGHADSELGKAWGCCVGSPAWPAPPSHSRPCRSQRAKGPPGGDDTRSPRRLRGKPTSWLSTCDLRRAPQATPFTSAWSLVVEVSVQALGVGEEEMPSKGTSMEHAHRCASGMRPARQLHRVVPTSCPPWLPPLHPSAHPATPPGITLAGILQLSPSEGGLKGAKTPPDLVGSWRAANGAVGHRCWGQRGTSSSSRKQQPHTNHE